MEYYFISQNFEKVKGKYWVETNLRIEDRLLYFTGEPIKTPIMFKITYNGFLPDYIYDGLLVLVSDKIKEAVVAPEVVFYPASVTHVVNKKERVYTNYFLMSPPLKSALDLELSDYEWIIKGKTLENISKAVVKEEVLKEYPIVRLKEDKIRVLCDANIYEALGTFREDIVFENSRTFKSGLV